MERLDPTERPAVSAAAPERRSVDVKRLTPAAKWASGQRAIIAIPRAGIIGSVGLPRPARLRRDIDTWQRHTIVARLAASASQVLDVGGIPGRLEAHLLDADITTANVEPPADVIYDGVRLPFEDKSFDVVTSLDVLEHIERRSRLQHVQELARLARKCVIACCPLGTPEHVRAEQELADWYAELSGEREPFLDEHVTNGLPTEEELRTIAGAMSGGFEVAAVRFHGDYRSVQELFRLQALAHFRRGFAHRARFAWRRLTMTLNDELHLAATPYTNRAFLVVASSARGDRGVEADVQHGLPYGSGRNPSCRRSRREEQTWRT